MSEVVDGNLKIRLPSDQYSGEVKVLSENFNKMMRDLNELIEHLKLEERQKEAIKFQMLLSQMNPHFLNNTLNTIKWIAINNKNDDIAEICISLGRILESSLDNEVELIHLFQELELIKSYIYIQNYRYNDRFKIKYVYDENLEYALILKFSLQPIVENAIYHGLSSLQEGEICIHIYENQSSLTIEVMDNGIGFENANSQSKGSGIGLKNLEERLGLLFKGQSGLEIESSSDGTKVKFFIPLIISPPYKIGGIGDVDSTIS